ncbi:MAG: hypothetical protein PHF46_01765 [Candidatus Gracilibacteria bacterium]|nr:hypothetical protein [Candidatus Gracilibacteria bacterium]MDD3120112.1 hypothetical protein [Candidatus Gracilibacteria bacterium]MDD4530589.1 hypothetical protein [Candidatus Gracilibacteria bacterium]
MINKDSIIKEFKFLYINSNNFETGKNNKIFLYAHKDRVGFNVVGNKDKGLYIIYKYGNILEKDISTLDKLFSLKSGIIGIKVVEIYKKYIFIQTDKQLTIGDFLMFEPNYFIKNGMINGPYLDNLIGNLTIKHILSENRNIGVYQSIDEESQLLYSNFPKKIEKNIILDVLWQDYLQEEIDLDIIYNIVGTGYKKLNILNFEGVKNINLDIPFKIESDFIENGEIFYIMCPIISGHSSISSVKIDTLLNFIKTINSLIKN